MRNNNRLYELAQMRENEYMLADLVRRGGDRRRNRLLANVARRLRLRSHSTEG
jgi:hypothetical protein